MRTKLILIFFVALMSVNNSIAADMTATVEVNSNTKKINITPYIGILPEADNNLTIEQVITTKYKDTFRLVSDVGNSFGFTSAPYWVQFSLHMDESLTEDVLLEFEYPLLDNLTLFVPNGEGGFEQSTTGETHQFSTREIDHRTFLFHLPKHLGETREYYLRLQTDGSMQIPLSIWTSDALIEHIDNSNFILGGYYGVMLLLLLAALAFYAKIDDKVFLFYAFYLFSYLLLQLSMNGFGNQFIWTDFPQIANRITVILVSSTTIGGLIFTGKFLQIWGDKHPRIKLLYHAMIGVSVISILLSLFVDYVLAVKIAALLGMLLPVAVMVGAISSVMAGYRPALYFIIAWSLLLFGLFISVLLHFGVFSPSFLTIYAMQIGSILEIALLGYALMDRINLLRAEKEAALVQAHSNLKHLNENLESLVSERTHELEQKNKQLSELTLRDSMTRLLNHNASIDYLHQMQSLAQRYNNHLAVIMLDIDRFKPINDKYGHQAGDKVIITIANILESSIRDSDRCGRYGGEEFILILPESDASNAHYLAERIRKMILEINIAAIDNIPVTASLGIAVFDPECPDIDLIASADTALYQAKETGRNQVVLSTDI